METSGRLIVNKPWIAQQWEMCNAATPGPWVHGYTAHGYEPAVMCSRMNTVIARRVKSMAGYDRAQDVTGDAEFISNARTALPLALDALEFAFEEISRLTDQLEREKRRVSALGGIMLNMINNRARDNAQREYLRYQETMAGKRSSDSSLIASLLEQRDAAVAMRVQMGCDLEIARKERDIAMSYARSAGCWSCKWIDRKEPDIDHNCRCEEPCDHSNNWEYSGLPYSESEA